MYRVQTTEDRPLPPAADSADDAPAAAEEADVEVGPTLATEVVSFQLSLVLPGESQLRAFLEGLYDPHSPDYRQFLDAQAFGERFGMSSADIERIVKFLSSNHVEVVSRPPQRTSLNVRGRVADVNRLFGVTLVDWRTADGIRYHRPSAEPQVPNELAGRVQAITGLDTEPAVRPAAAGILGAGVINGGLRPNDVARAYEIEPLHAAGLTGQGQTVAIISFDSFYPDDIAEWDSLMGITSTPVEPIRLGNAEPEPHGTHEEVTLDIQVIRGIAPGAQILNYEAPNNLANFGPMVARIVEDGRADIVNVSWGKCEKAVPSQIMRANEQEFAAAFAAGISIFIASGDDGAYTCKRDKVVLSDDPFERDLSIEVAFPASSPSVISVGGTFLSVREDGTYFSEAGWEDPMGGGGTGGGLSEMFERPSWQQGLGVENAESNGKRQVPDVAGPADPSSGFIVVYSPLVRDEGGNIVKGDRRTTSIGGTSAAAPFWVGSMALARQLANQRGVDTLGALGPLLYQLAASRPDVFHDVVRGGNLLHEAGTGWDYATGFGTPRVAPLAEAIVEALAP